MVPHECISASQICVTQHICVSGTAMCGPTLKHSFVFQGVEPRMEVNQSIRSPWYLQPWYVETSLTDQNWANWGMF